MIVFGGMGTIIAVSAVCVFLVSVVLPLFQSARITSSSSQPMADSSVPAVAMSVDEYRVLGWAFTADGKLRVFRLDNGQTLRQEDLGKGAAPTAHGFSLNREEFILGFSDGTVRLGKVRFEAKPVDEANLPEEIRRLPLDGSAPYRDGILHRSASGFRLHGVRIELDDPITLSAGSAIVLVDRANRADGSVFSAMNAGGRVFIKSLRRQENLMTGEVSTELSGGETDAQAPAAWGPPIRLLLSATSDNVYLAWKNGHLRRYDTRELDRPTMVEEVDLTEDPKTTLTALGYLLGRSTLLAGDSQGRLTAWFRVRTDEPNRPADGWTLVAAHRLPGPPAPVTALSSSLRTRVAAAGYANGQVRLFQITTDNTLIETAAGGASPLQAVAVAPKEDAMFGLAAGRLWRWDLDLKHPEASLKALFLPVWYEGAPRPMHVWQSSSGDDAFEPKLGLVPLVFGTLKATVYSLLFGVPLAMLAALYTSEFLHPRIRARIKPTIELMASLPSVVLGFLAALVIAPFVSGAIPAVLTAIVLVPFAFLLGGHLWQLMPQRLILRLSQWRIVWLLALVPATIAATVPLGPWVESILFAGDIKSWLSGQRGSGWGGWTILLLPFSAVAVGVAISVWVDPVLRRATAAWG